MIGDEILTSEGQGTIVGYLSGDFRWQTGKMVIVLLWSGALVWMAL